MDVNEFLRNRKKEIADIRLFVRFVVRHAKMLSDMDATAGHYSDQVYFNYAKQADVRKILRYFRGKWNKHISEKAMTYRRAEPVMGFMITISDAELPKTCKLVPYEVDIPEQVVAA